MLIPFLLAACGGTPNTPNGPTVGSPGGPNPPPTQLLGGQVTVVVPLRSTGRNARRPDYLSKNTESLSIGLASVNGNGVTGVGATVVDITRKSPGCKSSGTNLVCQATLSVAAGDDVFNVIAYEWPGATGDVLAAGTVEKQIPQGGGGFSVSDRLSIDVGGVIAKLSMTAKPTSVTRGKPAAITVALGAFDASGAEIVGPSDFESPITLAIEGDANGAFSLQNGGAKGSTISVVRPANRLVLLYDGTTQAPASITLQASVSGPNAASASAKVSVSGTPPPVPPGTIYALNAGTRGGLRATVTVYDGKANANAAPLRTINLSKSLYARSIAVDATGNLYVGYLDNAQGFSSVNGTPDLGNEVAVYSPAASGNATPSYTISSDSHTSSALFPIALAFDPAGDLVTYGATTVDANTGDAVLVYAAGSKGAVAPAHAWSFSSPTLRYAGPTGLAVDSAGNFYVNGALHTALGPSYGIFTNTVQNVGNPSVAPARTIPWDTKTQLTPGEVSGVSLDSSGEIFAGNYTVVQKGTPQCQARANVYASGATGGTTDLAPLRSLTLGGVSTTNAQCFSPSNPLAGFYPAIFAFGTTLFVADEFGNAVDAFDGNTGGTVNPSKHIAGTSTGLAAPIGVYVTQGKTHADAPATTPAPSSSPSTQAQVRYVEGAPTLETKVNGVAVPLGTSFLSVNGTTIASQFAWGNITQFAPAPPGTQTVRIIDSLGYSIGPFKTPAFAAGSSYSVVLAGSYPHYHLLTFQEPKPSAGATLAVYGASPSRPSADYGRFVASSGTGFKKLGAVRLGKLSTTSLGASVSNFGAYVGTGTTPITGGKITLRSVDSFDRRNALPFHNVGRISLFLLDSSGGSTAGPVFGIFDE
ncbi:MAG: hypothetical protein JOY98_00985 [Candidatus Eremiobacteraeota bacterium]|nr:hypothetical protein [Candidatus Eremiobacteraeota bacterium]